MENLTISIFENQFLLKTLKEIKLFSNFKINYYDNLDLLLKNSLDKREVVILFDNAKNHKNLQLLIKSNIPIIFITKSSESKKNIYGEFIEKISSPFLAIELEKKITSLFAKYEVSDKFGWALGMTKQGESNISNNKPGLVHPQYTRVDLGAYYQIADDLSVQMNIENLTDELYFPHSHSTHQASVGEPFNMRISIRKTF